MKINVQVRPNSRHNELTFATPGIIKIRIKSVPEAGKANAELIKFLADFFNIPQNRVTILSGHKSRQKLLNIQLPDEEVMKKLKERLKET